MTARTEIQFEPALPDTVYIQASESSVTMAGSDTVTFTVFLLRHRGQVANDTLVAYEARDSLGARIGSFSNITLAEVDATDPSTHKRLKASAVFDRCLRR